MRIKQTILAQINRGEKANRIKGLLAIENDKHPGSIQRWIDNNDESLTLAKNLKIIEQELGLTQEEVLEEEPIKA